MFKKTFECSKMLKFCSLFKTLTRVVEIRSNSPRRFLLFKLLNRNREQNSLEILGIRIDNIMGHYSTDIQGILIKM